MIGRLVLALTFLAAALPARADIPPPAPPPPDRPAMPVLGVSPPAAGQIAMAGVLLALGAISAGLTLARRRPRVALPWKAAGLGLGVVLLAVAGLFATWSRRAEADFERRKADQERAEAQERRRWRPRGTAEQWQTPQEPTPLATPPASGPPPGAPAP